MSASNRSAAQPAGAGRSAQSSLESAPPRTRVTAARMVNAEKLKLADEDAPNSALNFQTEAAQQRADAWHRRSTNWTGHRGRHEKNQETSSKKPEG